MRKHESELGQLKLLLSDFTQTRRMPDLVKIIAEKAESLGRLSYKQFCSHVAHVISTALHQGNVAVYNLALFQLRSIMIIALYSLGVRQHVSLHNPLVVLKPVRLQFQEISIIHHKATAK